MRLDGKDCFINRLGRWDDPLAQARAQAISAEIWSDYQQGTLDGTLSRYKPVLEGKDPELLKALEELMHRKRQGRHSRLLECAQTAGRRRPDLAQPVERRDGIHYPHSGQGAESIFPNNQRKVDKPHSWIGKE